MLGVLAASLLGGREGLKLGSSGKSTVSPAMPISTSKAPLSRLHAGDRRFRTALGRPTTELVQLIFGAAWDGPDGRRPVSVM
jgi:hypothetical protein